MSDNGKGLRNILEGVDLLGFGRHAGDRHEADEKRVVTAKVGKNQARVVTAKVGKSDAPRKLS